MGSILLRGLLLLVCLAQLAQSSDASLDISAFEYQRKFHKHLDLGECPQREVRVLAGNNSIQLEEQRCNLQHRGTVTNMPRELNDSRNVLITSAESIVQYLGLCGGEAASFLGILNKGDCVAVEIASRLTFNEKTLVRAFVGYYRKSLDILDSEVDTNIIDGMDRYYRDKMYLKHRSYGTMEIIFVQFRFKTFKLAAEARKVEVPDSPVMSGYMKEISQRVGKPRRTTVINLSTATQQTYEMKRFQDTEWERALRYVQIKELSIKSTRDKISSDDITPHLMYKLFPFADSADKRFRFSNPIPWEKTSILEVQLRQATGVAKKTSKKCRNNRKKPCRRIRELRRKLIATHAEIHEGRSNWHSLSEEDKKQFASRFAARVRTYSRLTQRLVKSVREMRKREKLEKLNAKRKRPNQIPMGRSRGGRRHRIRHSRRRTKVRKS